MRPKSSDGASKTEFLRSVARMYYVLGMNQQLIAKKLNVGRSSVARFLSEARESGIVDIRISGSDDAVRIPDLEEKLRIRYKLRDCAVADNSSPQNYFITAAQYISSVLPYNGIVAIGGGATLHSIGQHIHTSASYHGLQCVQSTGIINEYTPSTAVVRSWAAHLGAAPVYLSVPGIVSSKETKNVLLNDPLFKQEYQLLRQADICVFGIGSIAQFRTIDPIGLPSIPNFQDMLETCVGDICFHLYNAEGDFCMTKMSDHVCGLSPVDLLRIPVRIGAAFGREKAEAIRGALVGRMMSILLTDAATAALLLE